MMKRDPSDPRSWFYQAAIHGVQLDPTDAGYKFYKAALARDKNVANVDQKFWNQCPHNGAHSADFLPWHRAYTFHFEQILREHTGESDFALPYWNYELKTNRKFPELYGREHLDRNAENQAPENINPLFMKERDFYLTYYEHSLIKNMPLLELTDDVVDSSISLATDVFFGETESLGLGGAVVEGDTDRSTRGLLESRPHDHIHRVVGGVLPATIIVTECSTCSRCIDCKDGTKCTHCMECKECKDTEVSATGAMATPPTAGFDPIFSIHHTNIDRLWAEWSCMAGKKWGNMPPATWFQERPWFFFDAKGNCVNEPRYSYFDYKKLGIRFQNEKSGCTPLALPDFTVASVASAGTSHVHRKAPEQVAANEAAIVIGTTRRTILALPADVRKSLSAPMAAVREQSRSQPPRRRMLLRITLAALDKLPTVGFDVYVTTNADAELRRPSSSFVGSVHLFVHAHHGSPVTQDFDITRAVGDIDARNLSAANVVFVPFALTQATGTGVPNLQSEPLRIRGYEFLTVEQ